MEPTESTRKGWVLSINGTANDSDGDQITLIRYDPPRIQLEIDVPGIRSAGEDQNHQAHLAIQAAVTALQEALDPPSALPGLRL